jgi:hypothetical protein
VDAATFTGEGACFFELDAGTAAMVAGRFLADPPDVHLTEPGRPAGRGGSADP